MRGQTYIASYYAPGGGYSATSNAFGPSVTTAGCSTIPRGNDLRRQRRVPLRQLRACPSASYNDTDYSVDVVYLMPPDTTGRSSSTARRADVVSVVTTSGDGHVRRGDRHGDARASR